MQYVGAGTAEYIGPPCPEGSCGGIFIASTDNYVWMPVVVYIANSRYCHPECPELFLVRGSQLVEQSPISAAVDIGPSCVVRAGVWIFTERTYDEVIKPILVYIADSRRGITKPTFYLLIR